MSKSISDVNLGVADVTYDGTTVGHTSGGVTLNIDMSLSAATVDEFGETPIFHVDNGQTATVTVPLAQYDLDVMSIAFPFGTTNTTPENHTIGDISGTRSDGLTKELVLTPKSSDFSGMAVTIPRAMVTETSEIGFNTDDQTVIEVTFTAYPDSNGEVVIIGATE